MNKGENSAEFLCGGCFIGKTYNQKIVQNAFHDDFGLKNREHVGAREGHGNKGLLQLNTKYLTQNYWQDELLLKKKFISKHLGINRECDHAFSSLYELL